jgi:CxxC motif-containing protein
MSDRERFLRELTCIVCPIGCRLELYAGDEPEKIIVTGNRCNRGADYGQEEYLAPKRVVTCTCPTDSTDSPRIPVRTNKALPKELINDLLAEAYRSVVHLPAKRGKVVIGNFRDSGVDLVVSLSMAD